MGKAGAPYARTVQQGNPLPSNQMPDPGLVFDTLLKRDKVSLQCARHTTGPSDGGACSL